MYGVSEREFWGCRMRKVKTVEVVRLKLRREFWQQAVFMLSHSGNSAFGPRVVLMVASKQMLKKEGKKPYLPRQFTR